MKDWVVANNFGAGISVAAFDTVAFPLFVPPVASSLDPFAFEGEEDDLFCHRIVGAQSVTFLTINPPVNDDVRGGFRIMPLPCSLEDGTVQIPWDITARGWFEDPDVNNLRWWGERRYWADPSFAETPLGMNDVAHPYWAHLDLSPRQKFGQRLNLWPCCVIQSYCEWDISFRHFWRMLVNSRS